MAVKHLIQDMIYWVLEAQGYWLDLQIWVAKTFNYKGDLGLLIVMTALKGVLVAAAIAAVILGVAITTGILLALNALRVAATVVVIGLTALAAAVSPEDQKEYPLVWVNEYQGTRVFGTTLGHGNDTWNDPVFQDLLTRGFKWVLRRE